MDMRPVRVLVMNYKIIKPLRNSLEIVTNLSVQIVVRKYYTTIWKSGILEALTINGISDLYI